MTILAYAFSLLATLAALAMGAFFTLMVGSNPGDAIVAIWMTLKLYLFLPNALLAFMSLFTLRSKVAARSWGYFTTFAAILVALNFMTFPHKLGEVYFIYWAVYAAAMASIRLMPAQSASPEPAKQDEGNQPEPGSEQATASR